MTDLRAGEGLGVAHEWVVLERVDSTNDHLRRLAAQGAPAGTVVLAREQTAGRGRQGRSWYSPPGLGLYMSVLLRPDSSVAPTRWTLLGSAAVWRALRDLGVDRAVLKWPNDVVVEGKKLAGILAENRTAAPGPGALVLGFGVNVLHGRRDFPSHLRAHCTSVRLECPDQEVRVEQVGAEVLRCLDARLRRVRSGGWEAIRAEWESASPMCRGRSIRILDQDGTVLPAVTDGVDEDGALWVRSRSGRRRLLLADHLLDAGD